MLRFNDKIHLHVLELGCHFGQASVEGFIHHRSVLFQGGVSGVFPGPLPHPPRPVNLQGLTQGMMQDDNARCQRAVHVILGHVFALNNGIVEVDAPCLRFNLLDFALHLQGRKVED